MSRVARALSLVVFPLAAVPMLARADDPPCNAWEIEYATSGRLRLSDTAMGAGNGSHAIGPGKLVLRFDNVGGNPGGSVKVTEYTIANKFTVDARVLGVGTRVANDTTTRATPNACGILAEGTLGADRQIRWSGLWNGIHTDGTHDCSGAFCGKFGAPPRGQSPYHTSPHPEPFKPFALAPDLRSFHMDEVVTNRSSRDTVSVTLDGRETRRACVRVAPCP